MPLLLLSLGCSKAGLSGDDTGTFDKDLLGILILPESMVVPIGTEAQLKATGLFDDRTSAEITHLVEWSSADPRVAKVSNDLDGEGLVSGGQVGETALIASWQGIESVPLKVTVTDAELLGLTVEPKELDLARGDEVQLQALAVYSDGNRADSASQVRWITADGSVAQIAAGGVLTAAGQGSTTIQAEWNGHTSEEIPVRVVQNADADLTLTSATGEASSTDITLTITVANLGDKGAADFWVDVFLDPPSVPVIGDLGDDFTMVSYAGPGNEVNASFILPASPGSHEVYILVDTDDAISESDETNNLFGGTIDVGSGTQGPNLTVGYFEYISDGSDIYYVVDIYNSGSEDVGEFYVDLYIDPPSVPGPHSDGVEYTTVSGLDAGETTYADFLYESADCWPCQSYVLIDSYDYIDETDETDNLGGPLRAYN